MKISGSHVSLCINLVDKTHAFFRFHVGGVLILINLIGDVIILSLHVNVCSKSQVNVYYILGIQHYSCIIKM
jgi:hypothetical protein